MCFGGPCLACPCLKGSWNLRLPYLHHFLLDRTAPWPQAYVKPLHWLLWIGIFRDFLRHASPHGELGSAAWGMEGNPGESLCPETLFPSSALNRTSFQVTVGSKKVSPEPSNLLLVKPASSDAIGILSHALISIVSSCGQLQQRPTIQDGPDTLLCHFPGAECPQGFLQHVSKRGQTQGWLCSTLAGITAGPSPVLISTWWGWMRGSDTRVFRVFSSFRGAQAMHIFLKSNAVSQEFTTEKLKCPDQQSSPRVQGYGTNLNGINALMEKPLQSCSPLFLLFLYYWSRSTCANPFLNMHVHGTKIDLASDPALACSRVKMRWNYIF